MLGHKVNVCLIFEEAAKLFPKVVVPSYIPTKNVSGCQFLFLYLPQHMGMIALFNFSHSNRYAIESHCGF